MPANTSEMQQDIGEFQKLLKQALRQNVRQHLADHIKSLQEKLPKPEPKVEAEKPEEPKKTPTATTNTSNVYTVHMKTYAFDENIHSVKLYVNLPDIETLPADQITCDFTETSFKFLAKNLKGKNQQLQINQLCNQIKPKESSFKVRKGEFVITMKKLERGNTWKHLTKSEQATTQKKEEKIKDDGESTKETVKEDPQGSIMSLMKKMYDDGDDDMKRMINKTWQEGQDKKGGGGMGGMPGMPGMGDTGGMPDMSKMGGMGGMPDMSKMGGMGGMPDMSKMMAGMGGMPDMPGMGGTGGMPDMSKLMAGMGGMPDMK